FGPNKVNVQISGLIHLEFGAAKHEPSALDFARNDGIIQRRGPSNQSNNRTRRNRDCGGSDRPARIHREIYGAAWRAARVVADVPDQVPHLHGLLSHEQNDGAVAVEGSWI